MRVALDARKLFDGGIGTYIQGLLRALAVDHPGDEWNALVDPADAGRVLWPTAVRERVVRAGKYGLAERMRVLEFVPLEHLAMLLSAARVFAFPSRSEGFGLPPLEAMACGTPVVCTTGGALGEVVGDAALTAPPGDAATFAAQLERALDDEPLRGTLRDRGLARAATFTWTRTADATVQAYRAAIGAGAAA